MALYSERYNVCLYTVTHDWMCGVGLVHNLSS